MKQFGANNSFLTIVDREMGHYSRKQIKAPMYRQAFKFFRDNYNLLCYITQATISKGKVYQFCCNEGNNTIFEDIDSDFKTYEEAELECLKKLIELQDLQKLIETVKNKYKSTLKDE